MGDRSLIFPAAEYEDRIARFQAEMARNAVAALLLTTPADVFYATGFLTRFWESPARPWFLVVPASGPPVAVIPSIGAILMGQTWVQDIRTWDAPDPVDDGVSLLSETLAELVPPDGQIAVPMGLETQLRMPLADYSRVQKQIAPRAWVDGTGIVQRTREIKSEAEVQKIQHSCQIAGRAFDWVTDGIQAGRALSEVFRSFQAQLLVEGTDWVSYLAGAAGQGGYLDVISPATDAALGAGDVLMLDTGAVCDGYFCDFDRNFAVGPPSAKVQRVQHALWDVTEEVLATLRPGMRACDVHRAFADGLAQRGATAGGGRLGHGLGVTLTEWPSFTPKDETELRDGMVLTLEPAAHVQGERFLVHEENIVLRQDGAELLSPRAPRDLPVLRA